jgi:hypothetical protein
MKGTKEEQPGMAVNVFLVGSAMRGVIANDGTEGVTVLR